jgi:predicted nucleic acid-binding protein
MSIFVDTGAFYALADSRDEHHEQAKAYYTKNFKPSLFLTSEYVFVESWTLIHHKLGKAASQKFWSTIRSGLFQLQRVSASDLERAWEIFNQYADQDFSLVDCCSFAMMENLRIDEAFSFDHHFSVFRPKTGKAFRIHPS